MRKILIVTGRYLPGYKDGGPVRSVKNLTDRLGDEYEFRILTADRDHGDAYAYSDIIPNDWNRVGKAMVWYVQPHGFTGRLMERMASEVHVVYVCGCFNDYARTALKLKKQGKIKAKVVVAAMGSFSSGAFQIKHWKKKAYMEAMKAGGFFQSVTWSATSPDEVRDIQRIVGQEAVCMIARDLPERMNMRYQPAERKEEGLRVIFLSRISRKKNLSYAIEVLQGATEKIVFDVYGAMEDEVFYAECQEKAKRLPENVCFSYRGEVRPEQAIETFSKYHVFLFPTLGENYGHVIYEAMAAGCIPVISDRTPWRQIEDQQLGMAIPLEDKHQFTEAVNRLARMDKAELAERQRRTAEYAWNYSRTVSCQGYRDIFEQ